MRHTRHLQRHIRTIVEALLSKSTSATMCGPVNTIFNLVTFFHRHSSWSGCFQVSEFPVPQNKHLARLFIPLVFFLRFFLMQKHASNEARAELHHIRLHQTIIRCNHRLMPPLHFIPNWLDLYVEASACRLDAHGVASARMDAPYDWVVCTLDHFKISLGEALNVSCKIKIVYFQSLLFTRDSLVWSKAKPKCWVAWGWKHWKHFT